MKVELSPLQKDGYGFVYSDISAIDECGMHSNLVELLIPLTSRGPMLSWRLPGMEEDNVRAGSV